jgi:hypothetical protein
MASARIAEAIDVLKDGGLRMTAHRPALPPEHFSLQTFEKSFNRRILIAIAPAQHGGPQSVSLQLLLEVV